jgi:hypothetical protein
MASFMQIILSLKQKSHTEDVPTERFSQNVHASKYVCISVHSYFILIIHGRSCHVI